MNGQAAIIGWRRLCPDGTGALHWIATLYVWWGMPVGGLTPLYEVCSPRLFRDNAQPVAPPAAPAPKHCH
jgi:hypothetical protein